MGFLKAPIYPKLNSIILDLPSAILPRDGGASSSLVVDLHQRSPPGDQTGVALGVEPGRHGETGDRQAVREVAHRHEVVTQDLRHTRSLVRVMLEELLDEVLG